MQKVHGLIYRDYAKLKSSVNFFSVAFLKIGTSASDLFISTFLPP